LVFQGQNVYGNIVIYMKDNMQQEMTPFIFYTSPKGAVSIDVLLQDETVWLTQKKMATLFNVQIPAVSKHLSNIFEEGELLEKAVVSILETTAENGKTYTTQFYNLDTSYLGLVDGL